MYQSWRKTTSGVRQSGAGFIATAGAPPPSRAIVFNGSSQWADRTLTNGAPFTSIPGFQFVGRVRGLAANGKVFKVTQGATEYFSLGRSGAALYVEQWRSSYVSANVAPTFADFLFRVQFDPSNTRFTIETWDSNGTNYLSNTVGISDVSNWNLGGTTLSIGSALGTSELMTGSVDYLRWIQRVETMASGTFPTATPPVGVTYLTQYEFENNGNDDSGNAQTLTLNGSPTFEDTP